MNLPSCSGAAGGESRRARPARRPQAFRPAVEALESRQVLSTAYVVPMSQPTDVTHFHSLSTAMPSAGTNGTVIVEPGATADSGTVGVSIAGLTIKGDPNVPGSILPRYDLNVTANGVKLNNLNLGSVTVAATARGVTVSRSQVVTFTETGATSGVGHNTLSQNVISGAVDLQGNSGAGQQTDDLVEYNTFASAAAVMLQLTNSNGSTVRENAFTGDTAFQVGVQVRSNSEGVQITNNRVELTGAGTPYAVLLKSSGGAVGNLLAARVANNVLGTGGTGYGLYLNLFGTGAGFTAQVEGNDFHGNLVGVDVNGVIGATGAGNVDLGGGVTTFGSGKGGNNFRGFDGQNGHYAVFLHNTDAGAGVMAQRNTFDVGVNPATVVRHGPNGGGTGTVSVLKPLDADHAFVQNLFNQTLGRAGNPATGSDLDAWVALLPGLGRSGVVNGIARSTEALTRTVGGYFVTYLGRTSDAASLSGWVGAIQNGMPLEQVQSGILSSPEYLARINTDYVQSLYINVLHRTGSAADLAAWHALEPQLGLQGVAVAFTGSAEHRTAVAGDFFRDLLHREPGAGGAEAWAAQPVDLLGVEVGILGSAEFYTNG